jgi:hypothetical protein
VFKKKGTWEDATQVPSEKQKEYWMRDSSLHLSRCHRHRTIQKKAKWANAYAPLLTSGGMRAKLNRREKAHRREEAQGERRAPGAFTSFGGSVKLMQFTSDDSAVSMNYILASEKWPSFVYRLDSGVGSYCCTCAGEIDG